MTGCPLHPSSPSRPNTPKDENFDDEEDLEFNPTLATCHPSRFIYRKWVRATTGMRNGITRTIMAIAVNAATHPCLWVVTILCFSIAVLYGGFKTNFHLQVELRDIFTPTTSKSIGHREWALSTSRLPGYSATDVPFRVIIHAKGRNVITYEGVERAFEVWNLASSIDGLDHLCTNAEDDDIVIDLDAGNTGNCQFQAITGFWHHNRAWFERDVPMNDDITRFLLNDTYPDGTTVDMDRLFGNLVIQDDGMPVSAEALFVEISIPFNSQWFWYRLFDYADELQDGITEMRKSWAASGSDYSVEFVFDYSIGKEFEQTILSDFPLLPFVFTIMLGFCCCVFWKRDRVQSRLLLALGSVCTVLLSMATGFGLMFLVGVPFTVVTNILPYIIFGVGLDDTFIIHGAFERTDNKKPILDRVREVFEEVGLSITMTTLTTSLAFGLGCISSVPAIRDICFYAWPTVLIDGFYQVSFFVSLIVLDERRIQSNRMDCCPCVVAPKGKNTGISSGGSTDSNESLSSINEGDSKNNDRDQACPESSSNEGVAMRDGKETKVQPRSTTFMRWYADQLLRPWVQTGVLVAFCALFAASIHAATLLRQDFSFFDLLPSDSPTRSYLSSMENYGGVNGDIYVYFRHLNQSDVYVQDQMIDFVDQIAAIDHVELKPFCFVKDFRAFMEDPDSFVEGLTKVPSTARLLEEHPGLTQFLRSVAESSTFDDLSFVQVMDLVFAQPLLKQLYSVHMVRDDEGNIINSRCTIKIKNLDYNSVSDQIALLKAQNEVTENHPLNQGTKVPRCFLYKEMFHLWEFFDVAIQELKYTAVTGIATVTVFAFLFVPHWSGVLYVFPLMCVLYVDLLGLFQMFGLTINVLTYVTLVVSVGLLVDFLMHALLRYFESTKETREGKVKDMLTTMGSSILLGGLSTFLGSVPLIFSQSAVFRTIYIAFFCMISLGISHGLVLLPVLLSICGTTSKQGQRSTQSERENKVLTITNSRSLSKPGEKEKEEEEEVATQDSSSNFLHRSGSSVDAPAAKIQIPSSFEIQSSESPPNSLAGSVRVAEYSYEHSVCSVDLVCQPSNTYDQFEVTMA